MRKHTGSIVTYPSCTRIWPLEPDPRRIHIEDIAHALSNLCRYTGHVSDFYSVAEHCVRLCDYGPEDLKDWLLLHDASEAYFNDLAAPVKHQPELDKYREGEARMMRAVCDRFDLDPVEPENVKILDLAIRINEMRDLKGREPRKYEPRPLDIPVIKTWTPRRAKMEYLKRAEQLGLYTPAR